MIKEKKLLTSSNKQSGDSQSGLHLSAAQQKQIAAAVKHLRAGGTVAFPTETVYGLGADISIPTAINQIFAIKGRPTNHPLIVHFADISRLPYWAQEIPDSAWKLAYHFWPGPLTLILKRSQHIPQNVTGGQNTVGLRIPAHPVALALLQALGTDRALAAPSANRFGRISPTCAVHVKEELGQSAGMILDGGPCQVGLESTIVSFDGETVTVLRPGGITPTALENVLQANVRLNNRHLSIRTPGRLSSHYAPTTPLETHSAQTIWRRLEELTKLNLSIAVLSWSATQITANNFVQYAMPREPDAYGSQLYAILRQFDQQGFDCLLLEAPPDNPAWLAIRDRLQRASHTTVLHDET